MRRARLAMALAACAAPGALVGQEGGAIGPDLRINGFLSQGFDADFGEDDEAYASITSFGLSIVSQTRTTSVVFAPGVTVSLEEEDDGAAGEIRPRFNGSIRHRLPRLTLNADAAVTPELGGLARFDDDETDDDENGLNVALGGGASYALDPITSVNLGLDASFRRADESFTENRRLSATAGLSRALDPLSDIGVSVGLSRFDSADGDATESVRFSLNGGRPLSPTLSANGSAGVSFVSQDGDLEPSFTGGLSFSQRLPRGSLSYGAQQSLSQDDDGTVNNRASVFVNYNRPLPRGASFGLTNALQFDNPVFDDADDTRTLRISPRFSFPVDADWRGSLGYGFRAEDDGDDVEISHLVFFRVSRGLDFLP